MRHALRQYDAGLPPAAASRQALGAERRMIALLRGLEGLNDDIRAEARRPVGMVFAGHKQARIGA